MGGLEALLLMGGMAALYAWNTSRSAANLNYFPGNITNMGFSGINAVATAQLIIQNTSNVDFTINSVAGNAFTDNTLIGNIENFQPVVIPGNSQAAVPLNITLLSISLIDQIISAFQNGFQKKQIKIQGTFNANGVQLPLDITYQVG